MCSSSISSADRRLNLPQLCDSVCGRRKCNPPRIAWHCSCAVLAVPSETIAWLMKYTGNRNRTPITLMIWKRSHHGNLFACTNLCGFLRSLHSSFTERFIEFVAITISGLTVASSDRRERTLRFIVTSSIALSTTKSKTGC